MRRVFVMAALAWICCAELERLQAADFDNALFQSLSAKKARSVLGEARVNGRVGGVFDLRVTSTERSYNYKLRATRIDKSVATALARLLVDEKGMGKTEAIGIVQPLLDGRQYFMVELDPREGAGVIPRDWTARAGSTEGEDGGEVCEKLEDSGEWSAILRAFPRDYAYEMFLIRAPGGAAVGNGKPLELRVQIRNKVGRVRWANGGALVRE